MKAKDLLQSIKQADSRTELSTLVDVLDESLLNGLNSDYSVPGWVEMEGVIKDKCEELNRRVYH